MKRFIVTKNEFNPQQFCLYDVEGYGMYTWGSTSQRSINYDEEFETENPTLYYSNVEIITKKNN